MTPAKRRGGQAQHDGLHSGDGRALWVFVANPPRYHGCGGQAQCDAYGESQAQQGLGESNRGYGVCAEPSNPENVYHREQRFEHHLENHGHGKQQNRPVQASGGVVLVKAADRRPQRTPQAALG